MLRALTTKLNVQAQAFRRMSTATSSDVAVEAYPVAVQAMHWLMGGAVLGCVGFVQAAQQVKGKQKGEFMFYHKSCGLLAAGLLGPRLAIKLASKAPASMNSNPALHAAATAAHTAMYGMLVAMPITGVAMGYYGGKGLPFFWTTVPGAAEADKSIAGPAFKWHKQLGWYMELLLAAHIGAVGFHLARGEAILARIVPGLAK
jgi:1,2-dihydroxy-3-keto-5-methylthiopentene dioxygenase